MGRRVEVPLLVLALLALAVAVMSAQGLRMARDRFERLQPSHAVVWLEPDASEPSFDLASGPRYLVADLGEAGTQARVGLYQVFPERTLVRWIEPATSPHSRWLVVPLRGLQRGRYLLANVADEAAAGPREMDLPVEELAVIGRFRLDLQ